MTISKKIENNKLYIYENDFLFYSRDLETCETKIIDETTYERYLLSDLRNINYIGKSELIIVKARLKLKTGDEGGRQSGMKTGIKPNHVFEHTSKNEMLSSFIGDIIFDQEILFLPGEERLVTVRFLLCMPIEKYLNIGRQWWIHEGSRVIGEAEILEFTEMSNYYDEHIIDLFNSNDGIELIVLLNNKTELKVWNIAWGYDIADNFAHITTNISPKVKNSQIDFFYTDAIESITNNSGTILFHK